VLSLTEAPAHPHNQARGSHLHTPDGGLQPAPAPRFSATPAPVPEPAPLTGADTRAVLLECGLPAERIDALAADGVLG
jgi:alpha-methylacyl-CoA racemase